MRLTVEQISDCLGLMTTEKKRMTHTVCCLVLTPVHFFFYTVQPACWPHTHLIQFQNSLFREKVDFNSTEKYEETVQIFEVCEF